MRILLVEDSQQLQRYASLGLRQAGYVVDSALDGIEGLRLAKLNQYDAIILDLMLPGLDGLSVLENLRESGSDTPVLVLTAKDTVQDRVHGLTQGADDYLIKPFAFEELTARLQALIRRRYGIRRSSIECANLVIDNTASVVSCDGKPLELTRRELHLLQYLASRLGETVSRAQIEEHIYDRNVTLMSNVVDSTIYAIRRKLELAGAKVVIQTHRGLGYSLQHEQA